MMVAAPLPGKNGAGVPVALVLGSETDAVPVEPGAVLLPTG